MIRRTGGALAALVWMTTSLAAQDTTVIPVRGVEVTVTRVARPLARVPAAVSVINRLDVQRGQPGIGIEESLALVPGLVVNNRYNFALGTRISIRGFGARAAFGVRGIRILADGIPLTMPDGQANLNNVDLTSTGRIEIMRGAASMLYGNAAGGVVAFESETPVPGFGAQLRIIGGSDELRRANIKIGGGTERTRYLVSFARLQAEGFREHSRVEQNNLNARIRHELRDGAFVAVTVNAADAPVALNPGSLPRDSALRRPAMAWPRNAATSSGEAVRQLQVGLEHERTIGTVSARAVAYGITRSLENPLPFAFIALERRAGGLRSSVSGTSGAFSLAGGFDVELQHDERDEFDNVNGAPGNARSRDQTDRISNLGPFIQAALDMARMTATAGVRYDRTKFEIIDRFLGDGRDDSGTRTMSALSPTVGLALRLSDAATTFASVSSAFQTPTTTELINNPGGTGPNQLEPQRSISYEIGMRTHTARLAVEVSAYHTRVRDALVPYQIAGGDGREFFRNAGRTRQQGVEAAAQMMLRRGVRAAASYSWNDFVFLDDGLAQSDFEGNQLPGVPRHRGAARLTAFSRAGYAEIEVEHNSSYFATDGNSEASRNPAATVVDARLGYAARVGRSRVEPFVGLNNLLDEKYFGSVVINAAGARYFEPAPGMNLYLGLGMAIGNWH